MDEAQALVQAQPGRTQGRVPVVGQGATHGQAVATHRLGLDIVTSFHGAFKRAHPAHTLLEFFLGVAVGLEERARGLAQVVELAELVRHGGQHGGDRVADGVLSIRDDPSHRHGQRGDGLPQQRRQIVTCPAEQTARQQHFT